MELYNYKAKVYRVVDGDTIIVDIDLGFNTFVSNVRLRLARINAPETKGASIEAGKVSKDFLTNLLDKKDIMIKTSKSQIDIYGRYIAEVYLGEVNINDLMVEKGFAVSHKY